MPGRRFHGGNLHAVAMHPDGSAVNEMLHTAAQSIRQMACALDGIAGQIDRYVRTEFRDAPSEHSCGFLGSPVQDYAVDALPGLVIAVGLPLAAADADHIVPGFRQPRR